MGGTGRRRGFFTSFAGFTAVNEIVELDNSQVLVVGQSSVPNVKVKKIKLLYGTYRGD